MPGQQDNRLAKENIDFLMVKGAYEEARVAALKSIDQLVTSSNTSEVHAESINFGSSIAKDFRSIIRQDQRLDGQKASSLQNCFEGQADRIVEAIQDPVRLQFFREFLNRYAEGLALEAEYQQVRSAIQNDEYASYDPSDRTEKSLELDDQVLEALLEAFSLYYLMEEVRWKTFYSLPLSKYFSVGGHDARSMARLSIKLENLSSHNSVYRLTGGAGYFGSIARRTSDTIARHYHKNDRDRASALIIESAMSRMGIAHTDPLSIKYLSKASSFLADAERIVFKLDRRARVRLRFYLEKVKLFRSAAFVSIQNRDIGKQLQSWSIGKQVTC